MGEFYLQHLPVVNGTKFLGIISEYDLLDHTTPSLPLNEMNLHLDKISINDVDHIYEAIKQMHKNKISIMPVLTSNDDYYGLITQESLIDFFAQATALQNPGGIVVLEMNQNDYSLTEIAQIVETNDSSILNLYVNQLSDSSKVEVTLKINRSDLEAVINAFERYEYNIKAFYQESDYSDFMKDRFDSLMNYLNI